MYRIDGVSTIAIVTISTTKRRVTWGGRELRLGKRVSSRENSFFSRHFHSRSRLFPDVSVRPSRLPKLALSRTFTPS